MPLTDEERAAMIVRVRKTASELRASADHLRSTPGGLFFFEPSPPLPYWIEAANTVAKFFADKADELEAHIEAVRQRLPKEMQP